MGEIRKFLNDVQSIVEKVVKIDLYADGEYVSTTTKYKTVKDAIASFKGKDSISVAGKGDIDISGKKITAEIVEALSVFDKHQFKIAKDTLKLSDAGARILGGMTKEEARVFLKDKMGWSDKKITKFED